MEALRWAVKRHHWREHRNKQERQTKRDWRYGISQWERYDTFTVNRKTLFLVQPDFHTFSLKRTPYCASLQVLFMIGKIFLLRTFSWALWLSVCNLPALPWILSTSEIIVINSSHMQFSLLAAARFMKHVPRAILNASSRKIFKPNVLLCIYFVS